MHIVIIGNGIAGISTARHVRKLSDQAKITVISAETDYFWSRTALMYIYMGHMTYEHTKPYEDWFWAKNRIDLVNKFVTRISPTEKKIYFHDEQDLDYDKLVLATGSRPNKFGWPGQDLQGVQGMVSYQDLVGMEQYSRDLERAVIVGGGLIGIEMAEMFHSRHIPVTFLVREASFWSKVMPPEESEMINQEIYENGIDLRLKTNLVEILPDENGRVRAVKTDQDDQEIPCQFVGLTAGVHPNIELAEAAGIEANRGFLVNEYLETNVPDIFATGDCCELRSPAPRRRAIEAVWYTGKIQGPILAKTLLGEPTKYEQKGWFNSAKFMNMEYQTYGDTPAKVPEGETSLFWQHPTEHKSIRINYDTASGVVVGFLLMNVRYRQDVCLHWIEGGTHIETVLQNLGAANFDPEFFRKHEADIVQVYNQQTGKNLPLKRRKGLKNAFAVLAGK